MSYNFPNSPVVDQVYTPPGGSSFKWNGYGWIQLTEAATGIEEAPLDGIDYVRKNAAWNVLPVDIASWASITGKPATFPPDAHTHDYSSLTGIPATFAPTLPIPSSGVTGLDAAQTAQDTAIGTKLNSSAYTAADVLAKLITVDGAGSLLDADLLDGQSSAAFAAATHTHAQSDVTGLPAALTGKEPTIAAGTAAQYWQGTKTWAALDKAAVGLGAVDNTSDASKPVSTAQAAADALNVLKAGDTMTGDLGISKAAPALNLDKVSGNEGVLAFRTGTTNRWRIVSDSNAESANSGSHFRLMRYNDAGTKIDEPIVINRLTGLISMPGPTQIQSGTAIPAGGTAGVGYRFSATSNFGVFFGSGAPSLSAAKGSLYLRSDGSTTNDRMYINTNGSTTWTAVITVA